MDGGLAGDEWKNYALSTDEVWYYCGTNLSDVINVDYVTEPGVLQGHNLITRLTDNNGNYTFDAQVELDFSARDSQGNLIWNPSGSYFGVTGATLAPSNGQLAADADFNLSLDGTNPVNVSVPAAETTGNTALSDPSNSSDPSTLIYDINEALAATSLNGKVVAEAINGYIVLVRVVPAVDGSASLVVTAANQSAQSALGLSDGSDGSTAGHFAQFGVNSSVSLQGLLPLDGNYQAIIIDTLDGNDTVHVGPTVTKSVWVECGTGNDSVMFTAGKPILEDMTETSAAGASTSNDTPETAYDLGKALEPTTGTLFGQYQVTGLTLASPTEEHWYKFALGAAPVNGDTIQLTSISPLDRVTMELVQYTTNAQGNITGVASASPLATTTSAEGGTINLYGLNLTPGTLYGLHIYSDNTVTVYQLAISVGGAAVSNTGPSAAVLLPDIEDDASIEGRPLQATADQSWYQFALNEPGRAGDNIGLELVNGNNPITLAIYNAAGAAASTPVALAAATTGPNTSSAVVSLAGLFSGTYYLSVSGTGPADYELLPEIQHYNLALENAGGVNDSVSLLFQTPPTQPVTVTLLDGMGNPIGQSATAPAGSSSLSLSLYGVAAGSYYPRVTTPEVLKPGDLNYTVQTTLAGVTSNLELTTGALARNVYELSLDNAGGAVRHRLAGLCHASHPAGDRHLA